MPSLPGERRASNGETARNPSAAGISISGGAATAAGNARLRDEITRATAELVRLTAEVTRLREENTRLREWNTRLREENTSLRERNTGPEAAVPAAASGTQHLTVAERYVYRRHPDYEASTKHSPFVFHIKLIAEKKWHTVHTQDGELLLCTGVSPQGHKLQTEVLTVDKKLGEVPGLTFVWAVPGVDV